MPKIRTGTSASRAGHAGSFHVDFFGSSRNLGEEQLGGAPAGAQSYWQERFAACTFVERVWHTGRPWNCWGVAPNPTRTLSLDPARGRRKGTKSPLDPFSRLSWSRFHAPSACSFLVLRLSPCLLPLLSAKNHFFTANLPPRGKTAPSARRSARMHEFAPRTAADSQT